MTAEMSVFERLGGSLAIRPVTEAFYRKVLADDLLAPYFDDVDMDRQVAKQESFLTMVLGGPNEYTGRDLRSAHAGMSDLDDKHFDGVIEHLAATLREFGASEADVAVVGAIAESVRNDVLNR
jgi:truncated hemoglobin YjbI